MVSEMTDAQYGYAYGVQLSPVMIQMMMTNYKCTKISIGATTIVPGTRYLLISRNILASFLPHAKIRRSSFKVQLYAYAYSCFPMLQLQYNGIAYAILLLKTITKNNY